MQLTKHCINVILIVFSTRTNGNDPYKIVDVISNGLLKTDRVGTAKFHDFDTIKTHFMAITEV